MTPSSAAPSSWASLFSSGTADDTQPQSIIDVPSQDDNFLVEQNTATKATHNKNTARRQREQSTGRRTQRDADIKNPKNRRYQHKKQEQQPRRPQKKEVERLVEMIADVDGNGEWELTGKAKKIVEQRKQRQAKQNSRGKPQQKQKEVTPQASSQQAKPQEGSTQSAKKNKKATKDATTSDPATSTTSDINNTVPSDAKPSSDAVSIDSHQSHQSDSTNPSKKKRKKAASKLRDAVLTENVTVHLPSDVILSHSRPSEIKTPTGLRNMNNTCFVNSIIQPLIHLPHFQELLSILYKKRLNPERYPLFYAFWNLMEQMKRTKSKPTVHFTCITPDELVTVLREKLHTMQLGGEQNDAQEFLVAVLEALHKELLPVLDSNPTSAQDDSFQVEDDGWEEVGKGNRSSVVQEVSFAPSSISSLFSGTMRSMVRKRNQKASLMLQPFYCIHMPIDSASSVKECFRQLTSKESLSTSTSQQITFEQLPPVLILHLKRFSYNPQTGEATKIVRHISFDENLFIDESILNKSKLPLNSKQRNYTLHSVTVHHGSEIGNGHYSSMVRFSKDLWYNFDDELISGRTTQEGLKTSAYLLVYIRGD